MPMIATSRYDPESRSGTGTSDVDDEHARSTAGDFPAERP
jgi:hypothetical protein